MVVPGTAIYLYGEANCTYNIVLDSKTIDIPPFLPGGLLFSQEGLAATTHSIQVVAQIDSNGSLNQMLLFDQAVFTNIVDEE